jgi:prenyltransferase beta subunit
LNFGDVLSPSEEDYTGSLVMKKIMLRFLICAVFLCMLPCYAQSLPITSGVTWLSSSQNADGSWGAQKDLSFVYSVAAISALKSTGTTSSNYSAGITWVTAQDAISVDELSRKIISSVNAGLDVSALTNTLVGYKNSDGGWSYQNSPVSDPEDTALALQALKAANYTDSNILYPAVNYLTTNQNIDGGFGFTSGGVSNAYVTAIVLRTEVGWKK